MNTADGNSPEPLEIRRYSNRRFYDPSRSKHVTLEEIRQLIQEGKDVRVVDATTGEDITSRTLTQIILEYDDQKIAALPAAMLHRLIRSSESMWSQFMEQYLRNMVQVYEDSRRAAGEQWRFMTGMAPVPQEMANWWQTTWGGSPPPPAEPAPSQEEDLKKVIEDLREQLDHVRADLREFQQESPDKAPGGKRGNAKPKTSRS